MRLLLKISGGTFLQIQTVMFFVLFSCLLLLLLAVRISLPFHIFPSLTLRKNLGCRWSRGSQRWEPYQNKFIGKLNVFHIIQTLLTLSIPSSKLEPGSREVNGFWNHIMWWRGIHINFRISREYQTFRLIKNFRLPAGKQTTESKPVSATSGVVLREEY